jgi:hypothetical protein
MKILTRLICLNLGFFVTCLASAQQPATTAAGAVGAPSAVTNPALTQAWKKFQATMDEMRAKMENTPRFRDDPEHRAKAYHTLMEAQAMAYNFAIAPRMHDPRIQVNTGWQSYFYTLGQNGPDFFYGVLFLDGHQSYRLTGRMGDIRLLLMQVFNRLQGQAGSKTIGNYDFANFDIRKDGTFEVTLSATKAPGNWIALDPNSRYQYLLIRRAMGDWNDDPGELHIEPTAKLDDARLDADEFSEQAMAERIDGAADFVRYMVEVWNVGLYDMYLAGAQGQWNAMALLPGTTTGQVGSPSSNYAMAVYKLKDDEALLVELKDIPHSAYWSFQLGDVWSRSLDFRNYQTDVNMHHAVIDADGVFRAVVSRQDPAVPNWLDTRGHHDGTLVFRNYRSKTAPVPTTRVVKLVDIRKLLPANTPVVTPLQRQRALKHRRAGFSKLHGE